MDLFLASTSPRRRELLTQLGVRFELLAVEVDESLQPGEAAKDYVERVARDKAAAGLAALPANSAVCSPVLGADTTVVCDGDIFGKPGDKGAAVRMLRALSGREHEVMTAVALANHDRMLSVVQISAVSMRPLTDQMIDAYWATGEPLGKAGSYAIQGLAAGFISHLAGSFSGVMGLPIHETLGLLQQFGVSGFAQPQHYLERIAQRQGQMNEGQTTKSAVQTASSAQSSTAANTESNSAAGPESRQRHNEGGRA